MSVTITIENNRDHARENELVELEVYECQCLDLGPDPAPDCPTCRGAGVCSVEHLPFELNLANGNFVTFFSALGLAVDHAGELDGRAVAAALASFSPELAIRGARDEKVDGGPRVITAGTTDRQVDRYVVELAAIAGEAERREEKVVWA